MSAQAKDDSKQPVIRRLKAKEDTKTVKRLKINGGKTASSGPSERKKGPVMAFLGYFQGAWFELRQVRWPNRRATFGLTGALLVFTAIFMTFIILIDLVFENLFTLLVGN